LEDRLLRAGIAPRHVRRYICELEDHFADLVALQNARGYEEPDASLRARALLGDDEELTGAMLALGKFRSLPARAPWLVFGVLPPLAIMLAAAAVGLGIATAAAPLHGPGIPFPAWGAGLVRALCQGANYGSGPLVSLVVIAIAWRQRLSGSWPLVGVAMAAVFGAITTLAVTMPHETVKGSVAINLGVAFPDILQSARFLSAAVLAGASLILWKTRRSTP